MCLTMRKCRKSFRIMEGTYEACNIPFTDFQIRYQPEQIRIVEGKRILEDTAFLCRKDNDHFLILPSIYEKLDLDDWLLAHLFFYDKDGKRCIGVELSLSLSLCWLKPVLFLAFLWQRC